MHGFVFSGDYGSETAKNFFNSAVVDYVSSGHFWPTDQVSDPTFLEALWFWDLLWARGFWILYYYCCFGLYVVILIQIHCFRLIRSASDKTWMFILACWLVFRSFGDSNRADQHNWRHVKMWILDNAAQRKWNRQIVNDYVDHLLFLHKIVNSQIVW